MSDSPAHAARLIDSQRVAQHGQISEGFRQIAESNSEAVARARERFGPEQAS